MPKRGEFHGAVRELERFLVAHPKESIREACRQVAPDDPEALRSAFRRERDRQDQVLLRIARELLARDPSRVLQDLPDEVLERVTRTALTELKDRRQN